MKKRTLITGGFIKLLTFGALLLGALSCVKDNGGTGSEGELGKNERYIRFNMDVPYEMQQAKTRAITGSDENTITSIDVLAFKVETNGDETFDYHADSRKGSGHVVGDPAQPFDVKALVRSYQQRFVVITNAAAEINTLVQGPWNGILKDDMLKTLEVALQNAGDRWNATSHSDFKQLPMWGQSDTQIITATTAALSNPVAMTRMVAKINVQLDNITTNPNLFNEFKLQQVHVYNTTTKGRVVPSTAAGDWSGGAAINATMPQGWSDTDRHQGPLVYDDFTQGTIDRAMLNAIYTFEMPTHADHDKRPCVVVEGLYAGDALPTFYRVDFILKTDKSFMPILRNHRYIINITNVTGSGYNTADDAFLSRAMNMEVTIVDWNDGAVGDVIFDGQYHLAIRPSSEFEFARSAETQTAQIKTDYPSGWEVTKITEENGTTVNSGWLTVDKVIGALQPSGIFVAIDLTVDENTTGADRIGYVYVKAGRMNMRIMVTQTLNSNLSLVLRNHVTLTEFQEYTWITEPSVTPLDVDIDLLWGPRQSDVFVSNDKGEVTSSEVFLFDQALGYDAIAPGQSTILGGSVNPGTKRFVIRPKSVSAQNLVDDPLYDKSSKIEFIVNDGISGVLKKTINLRHWVGPKVIATTDKSMYDLAPGSTGTITVRSNTDFTVEISTEAGNNPMTSGGTPCVIFDNGVEGTVHTPNTAGTALGFTLGDDTTDPEVYRTTIKVIIKSPLGLFSDVTVNFDASLLIWVGSNGYAPAKSDSGNKAFFDAAALCPTGYILPTTAIVNAWKTSHYTLPDAGIYWTSEYGFRNNASYGVGLNSNVRTIYEYGKAFDGIGTYSFLHTRHSSLNLINNTGFVAQTAVLWGAWTSEYQHYRVRDNYGGLYGWESRIYDWDVPGNHYAARWTLTANGVTANVRCVKKVI